MLDLLLFALSCFITDFNILLGFLDFGLTITHFLIVFFHHLAVFIIILLTFLKLLFVGSHLANDLRNSSFELALFCLEFIDLLFGSLGLALAVSLTLLHFINALQRVLKDCLLSFELLL